MEVKFFYVHLLPVLLVFCLRDKTIKKTRMKTVLCVVRKMS